MEPSRSSSLFVCLAAGCLIGLGVLLAGVPFARRAPSRVAAITVVDRDTGLHRLDAALYPLDAQRVRWALGAVPIPDGGHWVLRACEPRADAPREIVRLGATGAVLDRRAVAGVERISAWGLGGVQWLEREGASRRWMRWQPAATAAAVGDAWCWTALDGDWAGDALGGLWKSDGDRLTRFAVQRGTIESLEVRSDGLGVVLEAHGRRALRLDATLRVRFATPLAPGERVVWLARGALCCDADRARLTRLDATGRRVRAREDPETLGVTGGLAFEGGVLLAAPGALLHYDSRGHRLPGQGGFRRLVGAPFYSRATSSAAAASVFPSFSVLPSTSSGLMRSTSSSSSASWASPPPGTASRSSAR